MSWSRPCRSIIPRQGRGSLSVATACDASSRIGRAIASRSGESIDPDCVVVEELLLLGDGAVGDDLPERLDPLSIGRRERADGPVAAEDDPVGSEPVEDMTDDRRQVVG